MTRLEELQTELERLWNIAMYEKPRVSIEDALYKENPEEWAKLNSEHDKATDKALKYWAKTKNERENLIIQENKKHHVYWERKDWVYDMVKDIPQHFELTGQERTRKFVEDLEKVAGVIVEEDDAGYNLEIFTPYKVYLYRFNRGYGNYPIRITKGFIAPSGNTYKNKIFLAKSTKDMKKRYHEN